MRPEGSGRTIVVDDQAYHVPRAVEAAGGAAIERWLEQERRQRATTKPPARRAKEQDE